jgi:hypothetical protein
MHVNIITKYKHISSPPLSVLHFSQLFFYPKLNFNLVNGILTTCWEGENNYRGDIDEEIKHSYLETLYLYSL